MCGRGEGLTAIFHADFGRKIRANLPFPLCAIGWFGIINWGNLKKKRENKRPFVCQCKRSVRDNSGADDGLEQIKGSKKA